MSWMTNHKKQQAVGWSDGQSRHMSAILVGGWLSVATLLTATVVVTL